MISSVTDLQLLTANMLSWEESVIDHWAQSAAADVSRGSVSMCASLGKLSRDHNRNSWADKYSTNYCQLFFLSCHFFGNLAYRWPIDFIWLGAVVVRTSDLWSTGCEFNSWPCSAGLVLGWTTKLTICGRVNRLCM